MRGLWLLLTIVFTLEAFGTDTLAPRKLVHNPFKRPASGAMANIATGNSGKAASRWQPELRAIMVAGKGSMVNVGGTLVTLGGEIEGYRLVAVREHQAVFEKGRERLTTTLETTAIGFHSGQSSATSPGTTPGAGNGSSTEPHISWEAPDAERTLAAPIAEIAPSLLEAISQGSAP